MKTFFTFFFLGLLVQSEVQAKLSDLFQSSRVRRSMLSELSYENTRTTKCQPKPELCTKFNATCIDTDNGGYTCRCPDGQVWLEEHKLCENLIGYLCNELQPCLENEMCINTVGSYSCVCKKGFARSHWFYENPSGECRDFNDCWCGNMCPLNQVCVDDIGTYRCECFDGFERVDDRCKDINECKTKGICGDRYCTNTEGSYSCGCPPGHIGDYETGDCLEIDECLSDICGENGICFNTVGSYVCVCDPGYWNPNGLGCELDGEIAEYVEEDPYGEVTCPVGTVKATRARWPCEVPCDIQDHDDCYKLVIHPWRHTDFEKAKSNCESRGAAVGFIETEAQYNLLIAVVRSKMRLYQGSVAIWTNLQRNNMTSVASSTSGRTSPYFQWYPFQKHRVATHENLYLFVNKDSSNAFQGLITAPPFRQLNGVICHSKFY